MREIPEARLEAASAAYMDAIFNPTAPRYAGLRAAAPFLQFELEMPTRDEWARFRDDAVAAKSDGWCESYALAFHKLIERRKATLLPEPSPAREMYEAMRKIIRSRLSWESLDDQQRRDVIAALGKGEK